MDGVESWTDKARAFLVNRLVWLILAIGALYWAVTPFLVVSKTVDSLSIFYFILMVGLAGTYASAAFDALVKGESGGIAQFLVGVVLFAIGNAGLAAFQLYSSSVNYNPAVYEMPIRGFLHLSRIVGAALLITATAATAHAQPRAKLKSALIIVLGAAACIALGFWLAVSLDQKDVLLRGGPTALMTSAPECPVLGTKGSRIYHDAESPYRGRIKHAECFPTVAAASAAGYRRWKEPR